MSEEETTTTAPEKLKPGRKAGTKMKRDSQGRLLKKDGSLAKAPGRKAKGSTKKETTTKKKTRQKKRKQGRPIGSKNKVRKQTSKTTFETPSDLVAAFKSLDVERKKLTIVARKEIESVACQIAECEENKEKSLIKKLHQLKILVA